MGIKVKGVENVSVVLREIGIAGDRLYTALEVLLRDRSEGLGLKTARFGLTSSQSLDFT